MKEDSQQYEIRYVVYWIVDGLLLEPKREYVGNIYEWRGYDTEKQALDEIANKDEYGVYSYVILPTVMPKW